MRQRRPPRDPAGKASPAAPPSPKVLAVRWLARREYSREELRERLRRRGVDDGDIARALDELAAAGYLSDARFAQAVVAQKSGRYGRRAIAHVLQAKGIGKDDVDAALLPLADNDEFAEALALWTQRYGERPGDRREHARQVRFLLSRGYALSVALRVLRQAGSRGDDDLP